MRNLVILLLFLPLSGTFGWADEILQVSIWANIAAAPSCLSNCTNESIAVNFLFDPASIDTVGEPNGWIDPNTFQIISSGFLGSFSPVITAKGIEDHWFDQYIPLFDSHHDELDISTPIGPDILHPIFFPIGTNTISWNFYACGSPGCPSAHFVPTDYGSLVAPVHVPDGDSWSIDLASLIIVGFVGYRYHSVRPSSHRFRWDTAAEGKTNPAS